MKNTQQKINQLSIMPLRVAVTICVVGVGIVIGLLTTLFTLITEVSVIQ